MGRSPTQRVNTQLDGPDIPRTAVPPCRDQQHLFFPPNGQRGDCRTVEGRDDREVRTAKAKTLCAGCQWRVPCLDYALTVREPWGIWGGLDEIERGVQRVRRKGRQVHQPHPEAVRVGVAS